MKINNLVYASDREAATNRSALVQVKLPCGSEYLQEAFPYQESPS